MKKIFLSIIIFCLLSIIFVPLSAKAQGLVPCSGPDCTICSFFQMLSNIYDFIVKSIATPLAIVALTIGGIFILISSGNPTLMGQGKTIFYSAIIGIALVWGSWLIINFVLTAVGYKDIANWSTLQINCQQSNIQ